MNIARHKSKHTSRSNNTGFTFQIGHFTNQIGHFINQTGNFTNQMKQSDNLLIKYHL